MVRRHGLDLAGDGFQRHRLGEFAAGGDHHTILPLLDQIGGGGAQAGGEQAVGGGGRAAALQVAEDGDAGFQAGQQFQLLGQAQRAFGVT